MIRDILHIRNKENPDKIFIYYNCKKYSFNEFDNIVNSIASFISIGFPNKIHISIKNKLFFFASIIACNRLQKLPILLSNNYKIKEDINDRIIDKIDITNSHTVKNLEYKKNETQAVVFSSGTTGNPKAAELTFNNFYQSSIIWNNNFNFDERDIYLNILPLNHVSGLCIMFRALYNNFAVRIEDYSIDFLNQFNYQKCTYISLVPPMLYDIIINDLSYNFQFFKKIILGGSKAPDELLSKAIKLNLPIYSVYGMTETCSSIAGAEINKSNYKNIKYKSFSDVDIDVENSSIVINSPTVMKKYMNDENNISKLCTNDIGKLDKSGNLVFMGRSDDIIVSGSENFSSDIIEKAINQIAEVKKCSVIGIKDLRLGMKIIAFVETEKKSIEAEDIYKEIKDKLPKKMLPKNIYFVERIDKIKKDTYL